MKRFLIILFSVYGSGFSIEVKSQPNPSWDKLYNGTGNRSDKGRLIATDPNNNVYVAGSSDGKKGYKSDIAIVKYNADGIQQWVARYNGTGSDVDYPNGLVVDNAGNVFVTGRSVSSSGNLDYVTIKYNSSGNELWVSSYDGGVGLDDYANDIKVDALGNVYVTGSTEHPLNIFNGVNITTIKYNADGVTQWVRKFNNLPDNYTTAHIEEGNSLAIDNSGNIYVTGRSGNYITIKYSPSGDLLWSQQSGSGEARKVLIDQENNVIVAGWESRIIKYSSTGSLIWEIHTATSLNFSYSIWDMALDAYGNIFVTGSATGTDGTADYRTIKFSPVGSLLWMSSYGGSAHQSDFARAIGLDGSGNCYMTGACIIDDGSRNGSSKYTTVKYNASGVEQWVAIYDGPDNKTGMAFDLAIDNQDNVYVTGEIATKNTYYDYGTVKYPADNLNLRSSELVRSPSFFNVTNYPNPFSKSTTIDLHLEQSGRVRLSVFDILGNEVVVLVNETKNKGDHKVIYSAGNLSSGTYFFRLQVGDMVETRKMILVR